MHVDGGSSQACSSSDDPNKMTTEKGMKNLQDAFDAVTRLTLQVKRTSLEISKKLGAGDASAMSLKERGTQLLKDLVAPSEMMGELLCKTCSEVFDIKVKNTLRSSAKAFMALEKFNMEIEHMYKFHFGKKPKAITI